MQMGDTAVSQSGHWGGNWGMEPGTGEPNLNLQVVPVHGVVNPDPGCCWCLQAVG